MGRWTRTINIKQHLTEDVSAAGIKSAAAAISAALPKSAWKSGLQKAADMADSDPETALLVFNDGLDRVYDWADANRVWLA